MRKFFAVIAASGLLLVAAPAASADAGPGYEVCRAISRAYTTATGDQPPWYCLYS
jgi:hypothetical protein